MFTWIAGTVQTDVTVNIMQTSEGLKAPKLRSKKYMEPIPYVFHREDLDGTRLRLHPERLPPNWQKKYALSIFYQALSLGHGKSNTDRALSLLMLREKVC